MKALSKIVVLTGVGISAESGIRTFRAEDDLWESESLEISQCWVEFRAK